VTVFTYFEKKNKSNDTLRDLFSRLKEASKIKKEQIIVPYSKINGLVLLKFYKRGLISSFIFDSALNGFIVNLKYTTTGYGLLDSLLWVSTISRRVFFKNKFLFKLDKKCLYLFFNEKGLFFLDELENTTSGGEFLCKILC
jgi:ribosomal protein S8